MDMKPTPETDNHARVYETVGMPAAYRVLLDLSRKLELERDEVIAELEEYRSIAESVGATKAVSERDKALDLCRKLELQRDEANNTSRAMVRLHDEQEKEIEQLCEERDQLRKELSNKTGYAHLVSEIDQLRKVVDAVVNSTKCQTCNDTPC